MADVTIDGMDAEHAQSLGRHYLIRFEKTPCESGHCGSG
jgi:hypothetical protein